MEDFLADSGEGLDTGRVKHLGGEVAAEGAPRGAVGGGVDLVSVVGEDFKAAILRAVGEEGTVLD